MAGLSKSLAALDQHLKVQNREALRDRNFAPMAPESTTDPTRCRWCRGALRELLTPGVKDYCQSGCSKSNEAPTVGHCAECQREFRTGRPLRDAVLCWTCETVERKAAEESYQKDGPTYRYERFKRGGYR
jgi:uncharacterized protein with PIN domain